MDNYAEAARGTRFINRGWPNDWEKYQRESQESHENMENQIHNAWEKNGEKSVEFLDSALENAKEIR